MRGILGFLAFVILYQYYLTPSVIIYVTVGTTQTIEKTLVDKVFALCDCYMQGEIECHSRHN